MTDASATMPIESAGTFTANAVMRRRVIWSSTIGNALEWFDFIIFASFAGIIGHQFFAEADAAAGLLAAYGLLAVAYIARPIGGIFFGAWADRVGRKRALVTIVLLMAFATVLIGLLPTYEQIGIAAPLLLLFARLIQGFSAGGEFGTSTAMLIEFAPPGERGFYASFQFVAQAFAFGGGALCAYLLNTLLTPQQLQSWGWRLPFLAGVIIGPIGFYLRQKVDETPEFKAFLAARAGIPNTPRRDVVANYPRALISLVLVVAGLTCYTYLGTIFYPNFMVNELGLKMANAQLGLFVLNMVAALVLPFTGMLSDKIGRRQTMIPALLIYLVVALFLTLRLLENPSNATMWSLQAASFIMFFMVGPGSALILETFPVGVRSTGASIVYNLAVAIFGGLAPLVVGELYQTSHNKLVPAFCIGGGLILTLIGLILVPRAAREK